MRRSLHFVGALLLTMITLQSIAQRNQSQSNPRLNDSTFADIKLRNIGPAFMSGRISDIAIHPVNNNVWYVAVGSGGVWKTVNAGITWKPVFDSQSVYSIGCITIDPNNPHRIWVGTGENIGGRHVGFGDGVYKSEDGGANWENMGLGGTEHISKIIVHPSNSNVIWTAAQGPLWNKGGERGLYKSTDGGNTWRQVLGDSEWVGVTDIAMDPRDPDRMYAATWQRHRNVAAYMGGGPGTGIYASSDGGETWQELTQGLPTSNMGKIGLALSPQNPDVIYAAIELDRKTGGVFRSTDRGASWVKQSDAVAGATGPHYYQELYASPHKEGRLYLVDAWMQVSEDAGKTFTRLNRENKHGDNHAIAFRDDDPGYLLVGTDGGVYESFDLGANWRFMENLPITQFYKVALDDAEPFYNIYGGTQDNSTQGGPSRTDNLHGIRNADWKIVLNWDGHQPATEPGNPDIMYAERQEGNLSRVDLTTGEVVDIQPQPGAGEGNERYNWDAPILVSPHAPTTIFFASQRVWKSENRGDSWTAISGDLTRNQDRLTLPIMGKVWGWDAAWDVAAMSNYNTITSLAESPKKQGLIYAGTDDGLVHVTEDGGANWRKIEVGSMSGVPSTAFVNDIKADMFDENTVYVVMDNHKFGDFKPYILKSTDKGRSWKSITSNLPQKLLVWRVVQDHEKPGLMFAGTEFGIYFTVDGGKKWVKFLGGMPTISFRDLAIQRRENDLVGASFGRGFFVLDDYSFLREMTDAQLNSEAALYSTRKAHWYIPRPAIDFDDLRGSQGAEHFVAPNPPFGAVFTYYLANEYKTKKKVRRESEKNISASTNVPFPGWDALEEERKQAKPRIWLTVKDSQGNVIRKVEGPVTKGFHRVAWDLRYPASDMVETVARPKPLFYQEPKGRMVVPGTYTVSLSKEIDGTVTEIAGPMTFEVERLRKGALEGSTPEATVAFWKELDDLKSQTGVLGRELSNVTAKASALDKALKLSSVEPGAMNKRVHDLKRSIMDLDAELNGNQSKNEVGEKTMPTLGNRLFAMERGVALSTYGPTESHKALMEIAKSTYADLRSKLDAINTDLASIQRELEQNGAPPLER